MIMLSDFITVITKGKHRAFNDRAREDPLFKKYVFFKLSSCLGSCLGKQLLSPNSVLVCEHSLKCLLQYLNY